MAGGVDNKTQPSCYTSWLVTTASSPMSSISILLAITCIFESVSSILNVSVFFGLLRLRRSSSNRYTGILLNLVVSDLLYNLTAEFLYIVHLALQTYNIVSCQLVTAISWLGLFLCLVSFFMLVLATFERYIAVFHPFKYVRFIQSRVFLAAVSFVYLLSFISTLMFRLSNFSYAAGISVLVLLIFGGFILVLVFVKVFWLRHRISKESRSWRLTVKVSPMQPWPVESFQPGHPRSDRIVSHQLASKETAAASSQRMEKTSKGGPSNQRRDGKSAVLIAFLLICMIVCYVPYLIGVSLFAFAKEQVAISKELLHWLWSIMLVNATLNPIIFFFLDKEIRYHISKVCSCLQFVPEQDTSTAYFLRSSAVAPLEIE